MSELFPGVRVYVCVCVCVCVFQHSTILQDELLNQKE